MRKYHYLIPILSAMAICLITLIAILDLTFQGKAVPPEIYAIMAASSGILFGGHFINKPPDDHA